MKYYTHTSKWNFCICFVLTSVSMFGFTFEMAQNKSDSSSIRQIYNLILISTMLENIDWLRYIEGKAGSSMTVAKAMQRLDPCIMAKNVFRLFFTKKFMQWSRGSSLKTGFRLFPLFLRSCIAQKMKGSVVSSIIGLSSLKYSSHLK